MSSQPAQEFAMSATRNRRLACVAMLAASAASVFGQTVSSTIVGTLADPANALVPNAQLTLTEKSTGQVRGGQSNEAGLFRFLNLAPGEYALEIKAGGFKTLELKGIALASSENRDLGTLVLQLGSLTE